MTTGITQSYPMRGPRKLKYENMLDLQASSLPLHWTDWCKTNCKYDCGWLFIDDRAFMGFDHTGDLIWFIMVSSGEQHAA